MKSYRPMGLFPMQSGSGLPKRTGLFGSLLSMASLNSIGDQERASFEFKASYYGRNRMMAEGMPYDYRNDNEYGTKVHWSTSGTNGAHWNLNFLKRLKENKLTLLPEFLADQEIPWGSGPTMAPFPKDDEAVGYIYPSYIIWINDPSYISFLGFPDRLELPKDVLRKTGGHPVPRLGQSPHLRPRSRNQWVI